ncbi:hypothetical protein AOLI_G00041120 [Acnodon oligacanthus]
MLPTALQGKEQTGEKVKREMSRRLGRASSRPSLAFVIHTVRPPSHISKSESEQVTQVSQIKACEPVSSRGLSRASRPGPKAVPQPLVAKRSTPRPGKVGPVQYVIPQTVLGGGPSRRIASL